RFGDLEVQPVLDAVHLEDAFLGLRLLRDDVLVLAQRAGLALDLTLDPLEEALLVAEGLLVAGWVLILGGLPVADERRRQRQRADDKEQGEASHATSGTRKARSKTQRWTDFRGPSFRGRDPTRFYPTQRASQAFS